MKNAKTGYPKGPYHYRLEEVGGDECYDIIAGDGKTVLTSLLVEGYDEEGSIGATAELFASAPELAEILEDLIDQIRELKGESSVIDEDLMRGEAFGKTYASTAREMLNNMNQTHEKTLQPGTRFDFWIDYPAPTRETKVFKVGLLGEFTHNFGRLKAFTVKLAEPIGGEPVIVRAEEPVEKAKAGLGEIKGVIRGEGRPAGPSNAAEPEKEAAPAPSPSKEQLAKAMHAVVQKGQRFDGDLQSNDKNHDMARIVFEKSFGNNDYIQARMFSQRFSSTSFKLEGKLIEDGEAPSGLAFDLKGPGIVMYRITLDGDNLTATDSKGKEYLFHPAK